MKTRTINLRNICELDLIVADGKFVLEFTDVNDVNKKMKKVNLHLERWWVQYIAENLWKVINREEKVIEELKKTMTDDC